MILIGLLLLLVVVLIVVVMVMAGNETVLIGWDALNIAWTPTALVVFLLGAGTLLLLVLAFAALRAGTRRRVAKGQELKRLRKLESEQTGPTRTAERPADRGAGDRYATPERASRPERTANDHYTATDRAATRTTTDRSGSADRAMTDRPRTDERPAVRDERSTVRDDRSVLRDDRTAPDTTSTDGKGASPYGPGDRLG